MLSEHFKTRSNPMYVCGLVLKKISAEEIWEIWKFATVPRMSGKLFAPQMVITELDDWDVWCIYLRLQFDPSSLHTTSPWNHF